MESKELNRYTIALPLAMMLAVTVVLVMAASGPSELNFEKNRVLKTSRRAAKDLQFAPMRHAFKTARWERK